MKDQERVPLRIVLRNFLNHIENLESQNCPEKSYEAEFQDLKIFSENVKCLKEYCCLEGEKDVNRKKNRYKDILPFDLSRVVLTEYPGIPGSDYINANFIKGASGSPAYIASQGPLPSTLNDFWRMVVQCEVQVIVMACNVEEAGKAKCEKYWVEEGEEKQFGMISVKLLKASTVCPDFSVRTMRLKYTNSQSVLEERTVCQLHYVAWPDHGVPSVVHPLLDMVRLVRDTQASETLPVLVHCSAGCGRTGTICAIDYVWGLLRTGKLTNDFSLLGLIRDMRKQRIAMVQTKEQYVLVHEAVRELFKEQLTMIDSHPYENIDTNGLLIMKEEENAYDSIEYVSKIGHEENCDIKENDVLPPPLPRKKHGTSFSKHEKEVENLTAQQKSIHYSLKNRSNLTTMPNTEKTSIGYINIDKNITFKKPQKDIGKNELNKPIPSKGILRVPHLEIANPKSTHTVKRSKSLKVVSSCDKKKFSFCSNSSSLCESKRRSSLESNLDENSFGGDTVTDFEINIDESTKNVHERKVNSIEKYNFFSTQRPLIRSYTTLEMRPKLCLSNTPEKDSISFFDEKMQQRCRLTRSSTHINLVKKGKNNFLPLNMDGNESNSVPLAQTKAKHNLKTSLDHSKSAIRLMKTPMESSTNTVKSQPVYLAKMESSRLQRGQRQRYISPTTSRTTTSYNSHNLFSPHANPTTHETNPSRKENISFIKIPRKTPLSKPLEYSSQCDDTRQYTKMCNVSCKEDLRRLRLHDSTYMHPRERGHSHISEPCSSNVDTSSNEGNDGPSYWFDRDNHRSHNFVISQYDYLNRRKPDFNPTYKCPSETVKGFHVQHCKEQKLIPGDRKYGLKNSSHYSISRSKCLPVLSPDSATYVSPKHGPLKVKLGEGPEDSSQGEIMPCARVDRDFFHSAPGVDLDQVAASISHNDGNLMKVALEAFHVRKVKMTTTERSPVKGPVIPTASASGCSSNPGKKKQQQYL